MLLRSSLPSPLVPEEMDGTRLSVKEGQEFYDLTLRAMKGALTASEAPRWEELLEKIGDRPTGSIAAAREYAAERQAQDAADAAAEKEALRQRDAERERQFAAMGIPRLRARREDGDGRGYLFSTPQATEGLPVVTVVAGQASSATSDTQDRSRSETPRSERR